MPIYQLRCLNCGHEQEELLGVDALIERCFCGGSRFRVPQVAVVSTAPHLRDENFEGNARHQEWIRTPEVQKKMKEGKITSANRWV